MKHKNTISHGIKYSIFEKTDGRYKMYAEIYSDNGGEYEITHNGEQIYYENDGRIDDWLNTLRWEIYQREKIIDFLEEVKLNIVLGKNENKKV